MITRRVEVWCADTPFDRLPADIRAALRPQDVDAYRGGPAYFAARARECASPAVRKFFRLLGTSSVVRLVLFGGAKPRYTAFFAFRPPKLRGRCVSVRLGPGELPGDPPPALAAVYRDVDGTFDDEPPSVGWLPAKDMRSIPALGWEPSDAGGFDPAACYPAYSHGNGDFLGYAGRRAVFLYDHELHRLEPYDLSGFITSYFGDYAGHFGV